MLDIKVLRANLTEVKEKLQHRGEDLSELDHFEELDVTRRELIVEAEKLKSRRNEVSQEVAILKREKKDADHLIKEMRKVGDEIKVLDEKLKTIEDSLEADFIRYSKYPT